MRMRILLAGLVLATLILVGGCSTTRTNSSPGYVTQPAIVQQVPVQTTPAYAPPPPVQVQVQAPPPGVTVVPGTPGCANCPPPPPQPYVPH